MLNSGWSEQPITKHTRTPGSSTREARSAVTDCGAVVRERTIPLWDYTASWRHVKPLPLLGCEHLVNANALAKRATPTLHFQFSCNESSLACFGSRILRSVIDCRYIVIDYRTFVNRQFCGIPGHCVKHRIMQTCTHPCALHDWTTQPRRATMLMVRVPCTTNHRPFFAACQAVDLIMLRNKPPNLFCHC